MVKIIFTLLKNRKLLLIFGFLLLLFYVYNSAYNKGYKTAELESKQAITKAIIKQQQQDNDKIKNANIKYANISVLYDKLQYKLNKAVKKNKINALRLTHAFGMCQKRYIDLARKFDEY